MKSLAYLESTRRKRGLEGEREFCFGHVEFAAFKGETHRDHLGGVHAQLEILAMCLRVKVGKKIKDL